MKTVVDEQSPTKRKLTIEVDPDELAPVYDQTIKRLAREMKIPGFRPGKAPKAVIETRLGKDVIKDEVLRDALPSFYARATEENEVKPITHPELDVTSFEVGEPLAFTATVEVRPRFDLPDYKGIEVTRPIAHATGEELSEQLQRLRDQYGSLEPVSRSAIKGDYVTIDIFGSRHGERIEGLNAEELSYEVGSQAFLPELDKELEGKKVGDMLKFNAVLPEHMAAAYRKVTGIEPADATSQADAENSDPIDATFQVVVKQVQAKKLPPLDDEFARLSSEFDTLEELKGELTNRIEGVKKAQANAVAGDRIMEDLLDRVEIPVPDSLVSAETEARLARLIRELERIGMTIEQYLEANEGDQEQLVKGAREAAEKTVAADLLLDAVAKAEDLSIDQREIAIEVAAMARQTGRDAKELMQELADSGRVNFLAGDILRRKALNFLVEQANITDEAAETDDGNKE